MATERLKTIKSSGGDYTSLSAAEAGEDDLGDLVTRDEWMHFVCYPMEDTTAVIIWGFTTDATTHYVEVSPSQNHNGKWNDSLYRIGVANAPVINIYDSYVRINGLQLYNSVSAVNGRCITCNQSTTTNDIRVSNCIMRANGASGSYYYGGIVSADSKTNWKIWNNIIYDFINGTSFSAGITINGNSGEIYNNTVVNCYIGIWSSATGVVVAKNNLIKGSGNSYTYIGTFADGTDYNATDSTDSIGKGSNNRTSQTFTFVDADNDDYHLASNDAGAKDYGVSDPGSGLFSDDIDGQTRSGTWDIGADEYVSAALKSLIARPPIHRFQHLLVR